MYVYKDKKVATFSQVAEMLPLTTVDKLRGVFSSHKSEFNQDIDVFNVIGTDMQEFKHQYPDIPARTPHCKLFTASGAHKLAKFCKVDGSHINQVYGIATAKEEVMAVESAVNSAKKANALYEHFRIVEGVIQLNRKTGIPVNQLLVEQHDFIKEQHDRNEQRNDAIKELTEAVINLKTSNDDVIRQIVQAKDLGDQVILKAIKVLQY